MYRLFEVDLYGWMIETDKIFYDYREFEQEMEDYFEVYKNHKWRLLPETNDVIEIDLTK